MSAVDISISGLILCFVLLLVPIGVAYFFRLENIIKDTIIAVIRMSVQLFLVAIFLKYIFQIHNVLLNLLWILLMVAFASSSVIRHCDLNLRLFYVPVMLSFSCTIILLLLYLNYYVMSEYRFFESKFVIVVGGMLLGNSLKNTIVGLSNFYHSIRRNLNRYLYTLSLGATVYEALVPYIRTSIIAAVRPTIATMATMGVVFIPGMMTGQILGGSSPLVAIKYQIVIMVAIYVIGTLSTVLSILLSVKISFNSWGILKNNVFAK